MEANVRYKPRSPNFIEEFEIMDEDVEETWVDIAPSLKGWVSISEVFNHKIECNHQKDVNTLAIGATTRVGIDRT